jgi:hypothetical protein
MLSSSRYDNSCLYIYIYIYDGKVSTYMGVQIISQTLFDYFVILYRLKSELIYLQKKKSELIIKKYKFN